MSHTRQMIREAIADLLMDETTAGSNVYTNRETPLWQSEVPAILIYSAPEDATPQNLSQSLYRRTYTVQIKLKIEANDTVDDDLDDLALEVENILNANPNLSGTALGCVYKGTEPSIYTDGEKEIGVAVLTYEIQYIL